MVIYTYTFLIGCAASLYILMHSSHLRTVSKTGHLFELVQLCLISPVCVAALLNNSSVDILYIICYMSEFDLLNVRMNCNALYEE
jgi:hypothetical protein